MNAFFQFVQTELGLIIAHSPVRVWHLVAAAAKRAAVMRIFVMQSRDVTILVSFAESYMLMILYISMFFVNNVFFSWSSNTQVPVNKKPFLQKFTSYKWVKTVFFSNCKVANY